MKKIFISYSHKDEPWKDLLVRHLKVLALEGLCDVWDDRRIEVGEEWKPAIETALDEAHIAILMISADFLGSNFIRTEEVPRLLERRKSQGVWVIPLFVSPCPWKKVPWLAAIQGIPRDNVTLEELKDKGQNGMVEKILADLAEEIAGEIQTSSQTALPGSNLHAAPAVVSPHPASGHVPAHGQWSNPFTDVLVIRTPGRFIGREAEMRRLKTMLQGSSVALLGDHKIGKSSLMLHLVRHWDSSVKIIGPLDCMMMEDRDDFFGQIAEALALDNSNWRTIRKALCGNPVVLLVDELELGPGKGLTYDDIGNFRGVCQSNLGFKIVTVSRTPVNQIFPYPGIGSRAYDFLLPYTLEPLSDTEARQLLNHPWAPKVPLFDVESREQLLKLAGSHPYKLQRAAFQRFEFLTDPAYDWQSRYQQDMEQML